MTAEKASFGPMTPTVNKLMVACRSTGLSFWLADHRVTAAGDGGRLVRWI
jgi:hypothetical protein